MKNDDMLPVVETISIHGNPAYEPCPVPDGLPEQLEDVYRQAAGKNPDWAEIADRYRLLMMHYPDYFPLKFDLASALLESGKTAEAEGVLQALVEEHPQYLFARGTLLALYAEAGRLEEGRILLDTTEYPAEELPEAYLHWALSACAFNFRIPDIPEAENWLDVARKIEPDHPAVRAYEAILGDGKQFLKLLDEQARRKTGKKKKKLRK